MTSQSHRITNMYKINDVLNIGVSQIRRMDNEIHDSYYTNIKIDSWMNTILLSNGYRE